MPTMPDFQPDVSIFRDIAGPLVQAQTPADWQKVADEREQAASQARQQAAQERRAAAEAEKAAQDLRRAARVRELAQKHNGAPLKILADLRVEYPEYANEFEEQFYKGQKANFDAAEADAKRDQAIDNRNAGMVEYALSNPSAWPVLRPRIIESDPEMDALLPVEFDATKLQGMYALALDAAKIHDQRIESVKAARNGDWEGAIWRTFADQTLDEQEWNSEKDGLRANGAPEHILNRVGPWSPDAWKRAMELAQTPKERATAEAQVAEWARDNERQAAVAQETVRHHGVLEGQGAQRVQIAQQKANKPAGGAAKDGGGRGVTSGDANRIADYDTSLDDLGEVRTVLSAPGMTGAVSALEAWTPDVVTDLTGYGTAAKQRQAVIDRVKQVIGKALEGGVLRKEDESKYEKILPTIRDAAPIVQSKLDGLERAIRQRRETLVESLGDAGYNVSAYERRTTTRATGGATTSAAPDYDFDPKSGKFVKRSK